MVIIGGVFEIEKSEIEKSLYYKWKNMQYRCENPNHKQYKDYGGRGISVYIAWKSFDDFYKWAVNHGYEKGLTLERINNDGDYNPTNCKWATMKEQGKNRRHVLTITIDGETKNAYEWCEVYNINYHTFANRRNTLGWDNIKSLTTPVKLRKNPKGFEETIR